MNDPSTGDKSTVPKKVSRRRVLQIGGLGTATTIVGGGALLALGDRAPAATRHPVGTAAGDRPLPLQPTQTGDLITRRVPGADILLPAIGLGTFQTFDAIPADARAIRADVLRRFWAHGGRVVDTSPLYGLAEDIVGQTAATDRIQEQLFVTNKIWSTGGHLGDTSHAETSLTNSMHRLSRTSPIDVMQCHALVNVDMIVPLLHAWKAEGRIRRLGVTHHDPAYFGPMATWIRHGDIDVVQTRYSIAERAAEQTILPLAADHGVAVTVNMPLEKGRLHQFVGDRRLPDFAADLGIRTWSQYFLKWVISHPAVTVALPATSNPDHLIDNMAACRGPLPDVEMRARMLTHLQSMPGFDRVTTQPWYPGKNYPGVMNRDMAAIGARTRWRPTQFV
ncbi:aldo/keto reductase [Mycolicibacterium sp. 018/SC-01/001]|uniref:aldo/keto reductase n=1 Tax=Mycolicibacterium sp. 018/SC-01/001 TaxID=2592069 RepID=UPI00163DBAF1|nr:aldo/keto reductase [Mycolicibacterium sp. 018/SC-01/001]